MDTFQIIRFTRDGSETPKVIETGLTKAEAKEHCSRNETRGDNWFDGFQKEPTNERNEA